MVRGRKLQYMCDVAFWARKGHQSDARTPTRGKLESLNGGDLGAASLCDRVALEPRTIYRQDLREK